MHRYFFRLLGLLAVVHSLFAVNAYAQFKRFDTRHVATFGDSLTDNEYIYLLFGTDPANYGADPMEAFFAKASRAGDQLSNFAVLGSTSSDVLAQVEYYEQLRQSGAVERATVVSIQAGGNDVLDIVNNSANLFLLASAAPGENKEADAVTSDIKINILRSLIKLQRSRRMTTVLWTVPDVTLTPYFFSFGFNQQQTENVRAHIDEVNQFIRFMGLFPRTIVLDVNRILTATTFDPPVILDVTIQPAPSFGTSTDQFADPIHPTGVMNAIVANELIKRVNRRFRVRIEVYSEIELAIIAGIEP